MPEQKVMKQIDEVLTRHLIDKKPPLLKKWQVTTRLPHFASDQPILFLLHYHHLILAVDLQSKRVLHSWYEKPADKRGLDSALIWLTQHGYIHHHSTKEGTQHEEITQTKSY